MNATGWTMKLYFIGNQLVKKSPEPRNFTSYFRVVNLIQMVVGNDLFNVFVMPRLLNRRHTLKQLIMDVGETAASEKGRQ